MNVIKFLNYRALGKTQKDLRLQSQKNCDLSPNLDNVVTRLACRETDVYLSEGDSGHVPPFSCKFRRDRNLDLLAVANEDGEIILIDTENNRGIVEKFVAHHNAIYDICWLPDKNSLISVSGDHRASLWDMSTCEMIGSYKWHIESIKSVDVCHNDSALFATGSRDGTICVWDTRDRCRSCGSEMKPSIHIQSAHRRTPAYKTKGKKSIALFSCTSSVSAVVFQDNFNLVSAGAGDGVVKVWDLRKTYISKCNYVPSPRYQMKYVDDKTTGHGCTSLVFDSTYKKLYASTTANKICVFDCHAYEIADVAFGGFRCDTYYIKLALSADDQYLACGSSDRKAYVWKTSQPGFPKWEFPGHNSEVTTVAWGSYDVTKFVSCGDDNRILVWKAVSDQSEQQFCNIIAKSSFISSKSHENSSHSIDKDISYASSSEGTIHTSSSVVKTPAMKSIKSFFQPVISPALNSSIESSSSCGESPSSVANNSVVSPLAILSPSKKVNQNNNFSPDKPLDLSAHGKENQAGSSNGSSSSGQTKRKSSHESTPSLQKAGKSRKRSVSNGKKQQNSEGSIKNYFTNSLSPK